MQEFPRAYHNVIIRMLLVQQGAKASIGYGLEQGSA